jgi:hypothetical protein
MISTATLGAALLLGLQTTPPAEAPRPESHRRMVELLARVRDDAKRSNPFFGSAPLAQAQQELAKLPPGEKPKERWTALREIAFHELRLGRVDASLQAHDEARRIVGAHPRMFTPQEAVATAFDMGVACLRQGEVTNCIAQHCQASCIFPIEGGGVHSDKRGASRAYKLFEWVLQYQPSHAGAHWLLNLTAMTLGDYPAKVPESARIDLARFRTDAAFPRFQDVAREKGLAAPTLAGGIVADDFDGDGVIDLVNSNWGADEQVRFWKGGAEGTFVDRTREAGLLGITGGLNLIHADYDNDGDKDVLVLRGAWMRAFGRWPNSLLRNDGAAHFTDVTFEVGLAEPMFPTQAAAWADFDNDGDLDLYIGNESSPECAAPSQLFRNDGGKFTDIAKGAGVTNDAYAKGVAWGDIDTDGFPDLYVSNSGKPNVLYRNRGDGTFENVTEKAGVGAPQTSFSTWFFDYDNDGALDLFVASYFPFLEPYVAWAARGASEFEPQALYKGDGKGGFRNVTREVGLERPNCTMGSNFGDLDNDGFDDLYLATGYPNYEALVPNVTLWNRGGASFTDVTLQSGMGHLQKGHGVALFDFDLDGDLDIYEDLGGAFPGDGYASALFENPGNGRAWIAVELTGVQSNRSAIGARIRVEVREGETRRSIWRHVTCGSSFGGNPLRQHFGLGAAQKVETLEVLWPTSKTRQVFTDVAARRLVRITEGRDELR